MKLCSPSAHLTCRNTAQQDPPSARPCCRRIQWTHLSTLLQKNDPHSLVKVRSPRRAQGLARPQHVAAGPRNCCVHLRSRQLLSPLLSAAPAGCPEPPHETTRHEGTDLASEVVKLPPAELLLSLPLAQRGPIRTKMKANATTNTQTLRVKR